MEKPEKIGFLLNFGGSFGGKACKNRPFTQFWGSFGGKAASKSSFLLIFFWWAFHLKIPKIFINPFISAAPMRFAETKFASDSNFSFNMF